MIGGDAAGVGKPDPAPLRLAIERAGGRIDRAVMVGDSATDAGAARAAGVPLVLVSFGYTATPAADLGADRVIDAFDDLPLACASLIGAPAHTPYSRLPARIFKPPGSPPPLAE